MLPYWVLQSMMRVKSYFAVDVECDDAVIVVTVLLIADGDDARCSADPCSGDDVRGACSVYLSARGGFSVLS